MFTMSDPCDRVLRSSSSQSMEVSNMNTTSDAAAGFSTGLTDDELQRKIASNELSLSDVVKLLLDIRNRQNNFHEQLGSLKAEMLSTMDVKIQDAKTEFERKVDNLDDKVKSLQTALDNLQQNNTDLGAASGPVGDAVDDVDKTIIVTNLQEDQDDSLTLSDKIDEMLNVIQTPNRVVQLKRLPGRHGKPGLVKVAFESKESKIQVLRAKGNLKNTQKYSRVWLRSSKTHAERLLEINFKKMLTMVPEGEKYTVTGSGKIEERDTGGEYADDQGARRGQDHRGRGNHQRNSGRGRGGRGRGNRGRYGGRD